MTTTFILCTWSEKPKATFIYFSKKTNPSGDSSKKVEKLSSLDPKVIQINQWKSNYYHSENLME